MTLPLPPAHLRFMGETDERFIVIGDELVDSLEAVGGLRPTDRVLDVGCGYGRIAHALKRRAFQGRYVGLDILPRHIGWCVDNLADDRYSFQTLDVHNDRYNPTGKVPAHRVKLPVPRGSFDLAVATSVFTHMWPRDTARYLWVMRNALTVHGRLYATFFLLDEDFRPQAASYKMAHRRGPHVRVSNPDDPLHAVGYTRRWVDRQLRIDGLLPCHLLRGSWAGHGDGWPFQDTVVALRQRRLPWRGWARAVKWTIVN